MFNLVNPNPENLLNFIVLLGKQFIYKNKCLKNNLSLEEFIYTIDRVQLYEYFNAKMKGYLSKHCKKWFMYMGILAVQFDLDTDIFSNLWTNINNK